MAELLLFLAGLTLALTIIRLLDAFVFGRNRHFKCTRKSKGKHSE